MDLVFQVSFFQVRNYSYNYSLDRVVDPGDACRRHLAVQDCCNAHTTRYIRKEGINRDNSRLGIFEMTAIRGTRSSSPSFSSLLAGRSLSPNDKLRNDEISCARLALCTCEKSQPTANRVTPLRPHAGIRKRDYGEGPVISLACRARKFGRYRLSLRRSRRDRP